MLNSLQFLPTQLQVDGNSPVNEFPAVGDGSISQLESRKTSAYDETPLGLMVLVKRQ